MSAGQTTGAPKPPASLLRRIWRVIYWGSMIAGAWGIILMLRRAPAPEVTVSAEAESRAEVKLAGLAAPSASSLRPGEPQRVALTEDEVNSYLALRLPLVSRGAGTDQPAAPGNPSVRDIKIKLSGDRLRLFVLLTLMGKDMTFELEGRLHVAGGYIRFDPAGGSLGELSLPASALDAVMSSVFDKPENRENFRVPAGIRDIRVEDSQLVIERQ